MAIFIVVPKINFHVPKPDIAAIERTIFSQLMSQITLPVNPQGLAGLINTHYFTNLSAEIKNATCGELQKILNQAMASLQAEISAIVGELSYLAPIVALALLAITDLKSVITWILKFIEVFLGPYVTAYYKYIAQIVALAAQIIALVQDAENALKNLGSCVFSFGGLSIPIPGASPITIPPILGGFSVPSIPPRGGGTIGNLLNRGASPGIGALTSFNPRSNGFSLQWGRPS